MLNIEKVFNIVSDQHEKCLNKVLRGHQSDRDKKGFSGTEIAVTLAEHLLGKLAPGKSYVVDEKVKRKGKCRCGYEFCESDPMFGSTGIGMFCSKRIQSYFFIYMSDVHISKLYFPVVTVDKKAQNI